MQSVYDAVTSVKNTAINATGYGDDKENSTEGTTAHGYTTGGGSTEKDSSGTTAHGYKTGTSEISSGTTTETGSGESKPTKHDTSNSDTNSDENSKGTDPGLVGDADTGKIKMVGTGTPGSHSALFGLTPDGHKETKSDSKTTAPLPSDEDEKSEGKGKTEESGSRDTGGERVTEQMHDPKVAEKGHGGDADP